MTAPEMTMAARAVTASASRRSADAPATLVSNALSLPAVTPAPVPQPRGFITISSAGPSRISHRVGKMQPTIGSIIFSVA